MKDWRWLLLVLALVTGLLQHRLWLGPGNSGQVQALQALVTRRAQLLAMRTAEPTAASTPNRAMALALSTARSSSNATATSSSSSSNRQGRLQFRPAPPPSALSAA